jgi:hypothetical protein
MKYMPLTFARAVSGSVAEIRCKEAGHIACELQVETGVRARVAVSHPLRP